MDQADAEWASERLGDLIRERAEVIQAILEGDYDRAEGLAEHLIRTSDEALARIGDTGPEVAPHQLMNTALRVDYEFARMLAGRAQFPWPPPRGEFREPDYFALTRYCPHNRASYDGNCVARPPCPRRLV